MDGRGYPSYKRLARSYGFDGFTLRVDHVQGDPFAAPSRFRVLVGLERAGFLASDLEQSSRTIALRDYLARQFDLGCRSASRGRGSGKSGSLSVARCGQEILERSSVVFSEDHLEVRFLVGLPARGRTILGREAAAMLCDALPPIVDRALRAQSLCAEELREHLDAAEDADAIRAQLEPRGLLAFVADGAVLPRRSGIDDRPLEEEVIAFESPESLRVEIEAPHAGPLVGMGIPRKSLTLIVGGGYHGKSTLLQAIARGVYNHIPGDGRERVVTVKDAVKVRAEDGRRVEGVDISAFIAGLPMGRTTTGFATEDASGSTSQATSIIESVEAGAGLLLMDEDTSATNFMIRDHRMQRLVAKDKEPITPFIDKVSSLYQDHGVSTILVIGGSGDYFAVADTVVAMENYRPWDATEEALQIIREDPPTRTREAGDSFGTIAKRRPLAASIDPRKGRREVSIRTRGLRSIEFGAVEIDLSALEQLVDPGQAEAIAGALVFARQHHLSSASPTTVEALLDGVEEALETRGLDVLSDRTVGSLVRFRRFELAAALNRLRSLQVERDVG